MLRLTLPGNLVVEGTEAQIRTLAQSLGISMPPMENDGIHYRSSTHGWIRIKDMNTRHIVNALRKRYRTWAESLPTDRTELVNVLSAGAAANDRTLQALFKELRTRTD